MVRKNATLNEAWMQTPAYNAFVELKKQVESTTRIHMSLTGREVVLPGGQKKYEYRTGFTWGQGAKSDEHQYTFEYAPTSDTEGVFSHRQHIVYGYADESGARLSGEQVLTGQLLKTVQNAYDVGTRQKNATLGGAAFVNRLQHDAWWETIATPGASWEPANNMSNSAHLVGLASMVRVGGVRQAQDWYSVADAIKTQYALARAGNVAEDTLGRRAYGIGALTSIPGFAAQVVDRQGNPVLDNGEPLYSLATSPGKIGKNARLDRNAIIQQVDNPVEARVRTGADVPGGFYGAPITMSVMGAGIPQFAGAGSVAYTSRSSGMRLYEDTTKMYNRLTAADIIKEDIISQVAAAKGQTVGRGETAFYGRTLEPVQYELGSYQQATVSGLSFTLPRTKEMQEYVAGLPKDVLGNVDIRWRKAYADTQYAEMNLSLQRQEYLGGEELGSDRWGQGWPSAYKALGIKGTGSFRPETRSFEFAATNLPIENRTDVMMWPENFKSSNAAASVAVERALAALRGPNAQGVIEQGRVDLASAIEQRAGLERDAQGYLLVGNTNQVGAVERAFGAIYGTERYMGKRQQPIDISPDESKIRAAFLSQYQLGVRDIRGTIPMGSLGRGNDPFTVSDPRLYQYLNLNANDEFTNLSFEGDGWDNASIAAARQRLLAGARTYRDMAAASGGGLAPLGQFAENAPKVAVTPQGMINLSLRGEALNVMGVLQTRHDHQPRKEGISPMIYQQLRMQAPGFAQELLDRDLATGRRQQLMQIIQSNNGFRQISEQPIQLSELLSMNPGIESEARRIVEERVGRSIGKLQAPTRDWLDVAATALGNRAGRQIVDDEGNYYPSINAQRRFWASADPVTGIEYTSAASDFRDYLGVLGGNPTEKARLAAFAVYDKSSTDWIYNQAEGGRTGKVIKESLRQQLANINPGGVFGGIAESASWLQPHERFVADDVLLNAFNKAKAAGVFAEMDAQLGGEGVTIDMIRDAANRDELLGSSGHWPIVQGEQFAIQRFQTYESLREKGRIPASWTKDDLRGRVFHDFMAATEQTNDEDSDYLLGTVMSRLQLRGGKLYASQELKDARAAQVASSGAFLESRDPAMYAAYRSAAQANGAWGRVAELSSIAGPTAENRKSMEDQFGYFRKGGSGAGSVYERMFGLGDGKQYTKAELMEFATQEGYGGIGMARNFGIVEFAHIAHVAGSELGLGPMMSAEERKAAYGGAAGGSYQSAVDNTAAALEDIITSQQGVYLGNDGIAYVGNTNVPLSEALVTGITKALTAKDAPIAPSEMEKVLRWRSPDVDPRLLGALEDVKNGVEGAGPRLSGALGGARMDAGSFFENSYLGQFFASRMGSAVMQSLAKGNDISPGNAVIARRFGHIGALAKEYTTGKSRQNQETGSLAKMALLGAGAMGSDPNWAGVGEMIADYDMGGDTFSALRPVVHEAAYNFAKAQTDNDAFDTALSAVARQRFGIGKDSFGPDLESILAGRFLNTNARSMAKEIKNVDYGAPQADIDALTDSKKKDTFDIAANREANDARLAAAQATTGKGTRGKGKSQMASTASSGSSGRGRGKGKQAATTVAAAAAGAAAGAGAGGGNGAGSGPGGTLTGDDLAKESRQIQQIEQSDQQFGAVYDPDTQSFRVTITNAGAFGGRDMTRAEHLSLARSVGVQTAIYHRVTKSAGYVEDRNWDRLSEEAENLASYFGEAENELSAYDSWWSSTGSSMRGDEPEYAITQKAMSDLHTRATRQWRQAQELIRTPEGLQRIIEDLTKEKSKNPRAFSQEQQDRLDRAIEAKGKIVESLATTDLANRGMRVQGLATMVRQSEDQMNRRMGPYQRQRALERADEQLMNSIATPSQRAASAVIGWNQDTTDWMMRGSASLSAVRQWDAQATAWASSTTPGYGGLEYEQYMDRGKRTASFLQGRMRDLSETISQAEGANALYAGVAAKVRRGETLTQDEEYAYMRGEFDVAPHREALLEAQRAHDKLSQRMTTESEKWGEYEYAKARTFDGVSRGGMAGAAQWSQAAVNSGAYRTDALATGWAFAVSKGRADNVMGYIGTNGISDGTFEALVSARGNLASTISQRVASRETTKALRAKIQQAQTDMATPGFDITDETREYAGMTLPDADTYDEKEDLARLSAMDKTIQGRALTRGIDFREDGMRGGVAGFSARAGARAVGGDKLEKSAAKLADEYEAQAGSLKAGSHQFEKLYSSVRAYAERLDRTVKEQEDAESRVKDKQNLYDRIRAEVGPLGSGRTAEEQKVLDEGRPADYKWSGKDKAYDTLDRLRAGLTDMEDKAFEEQERTGRFGRMMNGRGDGQSGIWGGGLGAAGFAMFNAQRWWRWTGGAVQDWAQQYVGEQAQLGQQQFLETGNPSMAPEYQAILRQQASRSWLRSRLGERAYAGYAPYVQAMTSIAEGMPDWALDGIVGGMGAAGVAGVTQLGFTAVGSLMSSERIARAGPLRLLSSAATNYIAPAASAAAGTIASSLAGMSTAGAIGTVGALALPIAALGVGMYDVNKHEGSLWSNIMGPVLNSGGGGVAEYWGARGGLAAGIWAANQLGIGNPVQNEALYQTIMGSPQSKIKGASRAAMEKARVQGAIGDIMGTDQAIPLLSSMTQMLGVSPTDAQLRTAAEVSAAGMDTQQAYLQNIQKLYGSLGYVEGQSAVGTIFDKYGKSTPQALSQLAQAGSIVAGFSQGAGYGIQEKIDRLEVVAKEINIYGADQAQTRAGVREGVNAMSSQLGYAGAIGPQWGPVGMNQWLNMTGRQQQNFAPFLGQAAQYAAIVGQGNPWAINDAAMQAYNPVAAGLMTPAQAQILQRTRAGFSSAYTAIGYGNGIIPQNWNSLRGQVEGMSQAQQEQFAPLLAQASSIGLGRGWSNNASAVSGLANRYYQAVVTGTMSPGQALQQMNLDSGWDNYSSAIGADNPMQVMGVTSQYSANDITGLSRLMRAASVIGGAPWSLGQKNDIAMSMAQGRLESEWFNPTGQFLSPAAAVVGGDPRSYSAAAYPQYAQYIRENNPNDPRLKPGFQPLVDATGAPWELRHGRYDAQGNQITRPTQQFDLANAYIGLDMNVASASMSVFQGQWQAHNIQREYGGGNLIENWEKGIGGSGSTAGTESLGLAQQEYAIRRQMQQEGIAAQQAQLALQRQQLELAKEQYQAQRQYQLEERDANRSMQLLQRSWQQADWNKQWGRNEVTAGWAQEDMARAIRFSYGRERIDLLRQQDRMVVQQNWQREDMTTQKSRQETQWGFEDQRFQKAVEFEQKMNEFQERRFALEGAGIALQEASLARQAGHMAELNKIEDQRFKDTVRYNQEQLKHIQTINALEVERMNLMKSWLAEQKANLAAGQQAQSDYENSLLWSGDKTGQPAKGAPKQGTDVTSGVPSGKRTAPAPSDASKMIADMLKGVLQGSKEDEEEKAKKEAAALKMAQDIKKLDDDRLKELRKWAAEEIKLANDIHGIQVENKKLYVDWGKELKSDMDDAKASHITWINWLREHVPGASGQKARGGAVFGNNTYLVGEEGPELFTPHTPGVIVPAAQTKQIIGNSGSNGNVSVNLTVVLGEDTLGSSIAFQRIINNIASLQARL